MNQIFKPLNYLNAFIAESVLRNMPSAKIEDEDDTWYISRTNRFDSKNMTKPGISLSVDKTVVKNLWYNSIFLDMAANKERGRSLWC